MPQLRELKSVHSFAKLLLSIAAAVFFMCTVAPPAHADTYLYSYKVTAGQILSALEVADGSVHQDGIFAFFLQLQDGTQQTISVDTGNFPPDGWDSFTYQDNYTAGQPFISADGTWYIGFSGAPGLATAISGQYTLISDTDAFWGLNLTDDNNPPLGWGQHSSDDPIRSQNIDPGAVFSFNLTSSDAIRPNLFYGVALGFATTDFKPFLETFTVNITPEPGMLPVWAVGLGLIGLSLFLRRKAAGRRP